MSNDVEQSYELPVTGEDDTVERVPIFSQLAIMAAILFLLLGAGISSSIIASVNPEANPSTVAETLPPLPTHTPNTELFAELELEAESVFVWDVAEQRVLHEKSPDEQLPLASITKLMTAVLAHELLTSTTSVSVSEEAIRQDGASGLSAGEFFSLLDISDLMLLTSSNDGAFAVAESVGKQFDADSPAEAFVALMNIRADELELNSIQFRNPTGLDISATEAGAYGSARDVAFLMEHILTEYPQIVESTTDPAHTVISDNNITHTARNTNQYVSSVNGIIGSKTGYTELAGGNLVVAFDVSVNRPIVAVVLGSSWQGRFNDINELVTATQAALN